MIALFTQTPPPFHLAGEIASLTASILWACAITTYRSWGNRVPAYALNLFKCSVATVCLTVTVMVARPEFPESRSALVLLVVSGVVGLAIGDTAFFAALRRLGALATASSYCLTPPLAAIIGVVVLGERLSVKETAGVALTVVGVAAVMYFGRRGDTPMAALAPRAIAAGIGFAGLSALAQSVGLVLQRDALQEVNVIWGTLLRMLPATVLLIFLQRYDPSGLPLRVAFTSTKQIAALGLAAFFGTYIGVLLLSVGNKYAKVGLVAALTSTFPLWVIPIARSFLGERAGWRSGMGTVLAVGGICLMLVPDAWLTGLWSLP